MGPNAATENSRSCGTEPSLPTGEHRRCHHQPHCPVLGQRPPLGQRPALPIPACPCGLWQSGKIVLFGERPRGPSSLLQPSVVAALPSPSTRPRQVPTLQPVLWPPDLSPPPLLSLPGWPQRFWVSCRVAQHCTEAGRCCWPHALGASGPPGSFLEARGRPSVPPGWARWAAFTLRLELHREVHGGHVGLQPLVTAVSLCWETSFPLGTRGQASPQAAPGRGLDATTPRDRSSLPRHGLSPWGHL